MKTPEQILEEIFFKPHMKDWYKPVIKAMNIYAAQFAIEPMHQCKYCGAMTDQPDENCYKAPKTDKT